MEALTLPPVLLRFRVGLIPEVDFGVVLALEFLGLESRSFGFRGSSDSLPSDILVLAGSGSGKVLGGIVARRGGSRWARRGGQGEEGEAQ